MTGTWFILSFIITAWGIALIGLGRRGRRIDDHPICRGCGFDLVGSLPPGRRSAFGVPKEAKCPECGVKLARRGAIEIGNRARRPAAIRAGAVVTAVGVVGLLITTGIGLSATGLARHQPTWMLVWRAGEDEAALRELARRISAAGLEKSRVARLVERGLELQREKPAGPWNRGWGDLIEAARAAGMVSDRQWALYAKQGAQSTTMKFSVNGPGEISLQSEFRYGTASLRPGPAPLYLLARVASVEFENASGSVSMQPEASWPRYPALAPQPGWTLLAGSEVTGFYSLDLAYGPVRVGSGPARAKVVTVFRMINADGSTAAEWEREFDVGIGR